MLPVVFTHVDFFVKTGRFMSIVHHVYDKVN